MEMIYVDHNKRPHLLNVQQHDDFSVFVKTNIFDLNWAKLMVNNVTVDEYTNLSHFDIKNIELHFPNHLLNSDYTILSKWSIELLKDFINRHFPQYEPHFWNMPRQYPLSEIGMTVYDDLGNIVRSTLAKNQQELFMPPSDIIIVDTQYFNKELSALGQLVKTSQQQHELNELDQFTMFNVGV